MVHGRPGCKPMRHAITTFDHVKLPSSSLLGFLEHPPDQRKHLQFITSRIVYGAIAFAGVTISALSIATFVVAKYSQRRTIAGPAARSDNQLAPRVPIMSFRTQSRPVLLAIAQIFVFKAFYERVTQFLSDTSNSYDQRHAVAVILKLLVQRTAYQSFSVLPERCGAQGLMRYNQIGTYAVSSSPIYLLISQNSVFLPMQSRLNPLELRSQRAMLLSSPYVGHFPLLFLFNV